MDLSTTFSNSDAWSVGLNGLPSALEGVETKLFQAGLLPYLGYLWFLNQDETNAPELTKFGAKFLLLFVFATIPAGIMAKSQFGDILANVDVLHGSSEAMLTLSNFFFFIGFARALADPINKCSKSIPWQSVGVFVGTTFIASGVSFVGISPLLEALGISLRDEPANALSLPTWGIHVSSVTEWFAAMCAVWSYAEVSGNQAWKGLTWAMVPFLASGLTACTFHIFYNAPELNALVPLQALLTLTGNTGCAFAVYRVWNQGKKLLNGGVFTTESSEVTLEENLLAFKLALWTSMTALIIKYGELAIESPFEPSYLKAAILIVLPTALLTAYATRGLNSIDNAPLSMDRVKSYGVAGTLSYVIIELAFWAIAFPIALSWYRVADGTWLNLSNTSDKAKLLGAGAVFVNTVRLLVPLRLGAAIAIAPKVEQALKITGLGTDKIGQRQNFNDLKNFEDPVEHDNTWSFETFINGLLRKEDGETMAGSSSDLPSLADRLPDCPNTRWDFEGIDLDSTQTMYRNTDLPVCPIEIEVKFDTAHLDRENAELEWLKLHREEIKAKMLKHGCVHLKGMEVSKTGGGFRRMYEALDMNVCLDPIHTSGLRKFAIKDDGIYEEVNKPALRQHYIGLHNESTTNRSAAFGAFVCFQRATESGGEFFIADGKRILRDINKNVLKRLYERKVRISVSNLDFFYPMIKDRGFPNQEISSQLVKRAKKDTAKLVGANAAPMFDMDLEMIWGADGALGGNRLQAVEKAESPVNRHPVTNEPVWFCNIHNHARYLRENRPCTIPEVGMTEAYYGDMTRIDDSDLLEIDRASRENIVSILMQPGEVLLVDNYRVLHGRDVFEGDRYHAVSWFTWPEEAHLRESEANSKIGDLLNRSVNKFLDLLPK
ncbi:MAG: hypothetical protein CMO44_15820 [Verrucomicrobiales bacterium]|nr:hypothetical protein [Verrucomicrobiales bacterium]